MAKNKPVLGITMGDPASIGPEIAIKTLLNKETYEKCFPLLVGDAGVLENALKKMGKKAKINKVDSVDKAKYEFGTIDIYDLEYPDISKLEMGKITALAGDIAFKTVTTNIQLALDGKIDGTVTGPINKESLHKAGHYYSGHTEIYAEYTDTKKYAMLLVEDNLRVIHVSTHVSLREACDLVKKDRILDTIELIDDACRKLGVDNPKIGVAGLNPHASDGGLFGWEEEKEIYPAVQTALKKGYNVEGPVPPDTMFSKAMGGVYDGCVAMYHDQGHIPFKVVSFRP